MGLYRIGPSHSASAYPAHGNSFIFLLLYFQCVCVYVYVSLSLFLFLSFSLYLHLFICHRKKYELYLRSAYTVLITNTYENFFLIKSCVNIYLWIIGAMHSNLDHQNIITGHDNDNEKYSCLISTKLFLS